MSCAVAAFTGVTERNSESASTLAWMSVKMNEFAQSRSIAMPTFNLTRFTITDVVVKPAKCVERNAKEITLAGLTSTLGASMKTMLQDVPDLSTSIGVRRIDFACRQRLNVFWILLSYECSFIYMLSKYFCGDPT